LHVVTQDMTPGLRQGIEVDEYLVLTRHCRSRRERHYCGAGFAARPERREDRRSVAQDVNEAGTF
jgi:hypothetical protein